MALSTTELASESLAAAEDVQNLRALLMHLRRAIPLCGQSSEWPRLVQPTQPFRKSHLRV